MVDPFLSSSPFSLSALLSWYHSSSQQGPVAGFEAILHHTSSLPYPFQLPLIVSAVHESSQQKCLASSSLLNQLKHLLSLHCLQELFPAYIITLRVKNFNTRIYEEHKHLILCILSPKTPPTHLGDEIEVYKQEKYIGYMTIYDTAFF